eukprot:scaffold45696_cov27-Tisochrysis_lutea.AAC.5
MASAGASRAARLLRCAVHTLTASRRMPSPPAGGVMGLNRSREVALHACRGPPRRCAGPTHSSADSRVSVGGCVEVARVDEALTVRLQQEGPPSVDDAARTRSRLRARRPTRTVMARLRPSPCGSAGRAAPRASGPAREASPRPARAPRSTASPLRPRPT